ncbi:hypothetical protein U9M48_030494 [Paspalum notatum var. saurae]|uniref:Uncharacterized protein n=1 Tax=Paspalum notatum var. saurae TaxID=547442 RepID=A0AAQ3U359_PASNO
MASMHQGDRVPPLECEFGEAILDAQGLWEAVSPSGDAEVDAQKNKTARAQLLQALPEDILMQVSTKKTAMWRYREIQFSGRADAMKV